MKIVLENIFEDDIIEINEKFWYNLDIQNWEEVTLNTEHLSDLEPLDWIQEWLDVWYSLLWDNEEWVYRLIED